MKQRSALTFLFLLHLVLTIVAAWIVIVQGREPDLFFIPSLVTLVVFTLWVGYEVIRSPRLHVSEKAMWITGLLFMGTLTGFIYLLVGRKKATGLGALNSSHP